MDQKDVIEFLTRDHQKLERVIGHLTRDEIVTEVILGDWVVKDIIAHISAWNLEIVTAVEDVLNDRKPWYTDKSEAEFNQREVEKRSSWSLDRVLQEWQHSFNNLVQRVKDLTDQEWNYQAKFTWSNGSPVTVKSLFDYRYLGEGHEGGHAKQIKAHFRR